MTSENRTEPALLAENIQKTVGCYESGYVGYVCKKEDVFGEANIINFKTYNSVMFPGSENVMYVPTGTLLPKCVMPTMIGHVDIAQDKKKKQPKRKQVNNNFMPYAVIVSKDSLVDMYERVMGATALGIQKHLEESIILHSKDILERKKPYAPSMGKKANLVVDLLADDEVMVLYITQLSFWSHITNNSPFLFNDEMLKINDEEGGRGVNERNDHLPIPVYGMIHPPLESSDPKKSRVLGPENRHIGTFLMTVERMANTVSQYVGDMSDSEIAELCYTANMCSKDVMSVDDDCVEGRLNVLGVYMNYRAENCLYTELDMERFLKVKPGDQNCSSLPPDNGLAVAQMIAGCTFTAKTSANVDVPKIVAAPEWQQQKKQKETVAACQSMPGSVTEVLLNHTACRDVKMASWLMYLLYASIDKTIISVKNKCHNCNRQQIGVCVDTLLTRAGIVQSTEKDIHVHVGGLFLSTTNMSTTFAGSAKVKVEPEKAANMTGKEYVDLLWAPQIKGARSNIIRECDLGANMGKCENFLQLFQQFVKNVKGVENFAKSLSLPDPEKLGGKKLEAVWIGKSTSELKYLGLLHSYVNRTSLIRRLMSAVSKYGIEVNEDNVFPLMLDSLSTKFYTFRPKTGALTDKFVGCDLKYYPMRPVSEVVSTIDGKKTLWTTCGSPGTLKLDFSLTRERLLDTVEKQKFYMASLPNREGQQQNHEGYGQMTSAIPAPKTHIKSQEQVTAHRNQVESLANKLVTTLKQHAMNLKVDVGNVNNNKKQVNAMRQVIEKTELVHLTYLSEHMSYNSLDMLQKIMATAIVLHRSGLTPEWSEKKRTNVGAYVHYNKLEGNLESVPTKNTLLYIDDGMYDHEITESSGVLMYNRFQIADYASSSSEKNGDRVYSTCVENYHFTYDNMWFIVASKNKQNKSCKPVKGCFFATPIGKSNDKYTGVRRGFKDSCQELLMKANQAVNMVEIVELLFSYCTTNEDVAEQIQNTVSVEDEIDEDGNVLGTKVITDINDDHVTMLGDRMGLEQFMSYQSVRTALKALALKEKSGDELYEKALEQARVEDDANSGEDEEDYTGLVDDILGGNDKSDDDSESSSSEENDSSGEEDDKEPEKMESSPVKEITTTSAASERKRKKEGSSGKQPATKKKFDRQDIM